MNLAWLTAMSGERFNVNRLDYADVTRQPITGSWMLRVSTQSDGPPVTLCADPRQSVVMAGLNMLTARGWIPVQPHEPGRPGAAVNPRSLDAVHYQRTPQDWTLDRGPEPADAEADDNEQPDGWDVVLDTISGARSRMIHTPTRREDLTTSNNR